MRKREKEWNEKERKKRVEMKKYKENMDLERK
jgi:hypothetical protein